MNLQIQRKIVGVSDAPGSDRYRFLLDALAEVYPVEIRRVDPRAAGNLDALIVLDGNVAAGLAAAQKGIAAFVAADGHQPSTVSAPDEPICFENSTSLDAYLRGQKMTEKEPAAFSALEVQAGDRIMARKGGSPLWLSRAAGRGTCQIAAVAPPVLPKDEYLFPHLNGRRFAALLPLMNFLSLLVKDVDWQSAGPQACFVFDDPSLHRPSYGFLDYRRLAEHAARHNYFVSVATVPLDAWWVSSTVAAIFNSHNPRLSLLIHGNNHTSCELLFENQRASHLALAAQAMRRMERLEQKCGIPFLRIMEPPHGVMAHGMFAHLLALGYEAALGTAEWLVRYNPRAVWPASLGIDRSELLGGGLPVLPRIRMSSDWRNEVLLAAFLRQPIVLVGHHRDASDRLELLAAFADLINHLSGAGWASPLGMVRSNYKELRRGDALALKAYSRGIHFVVPEGVRQLFVHRPWLGSEGAGEMVVVRNSGQELFRRVANETVGPIAVNPSDVLEISSPPPNPIDYRTLRAPGLRCWPLLRKALMEVRDRLSPVLPFAMRLHRRATLNLP